MPTRLDLTVSERERKASEHRLEFESAIAGAQAGEVRCAIDGIEAGSANWALVAPGIYSILLDGCSYDVHVAKATGAAKAPDYEVSVNGKAFHVVVRDPRARRQLAAGGANGPREVAAPMPGKIVRVLVREGDQVEADQGLLVIEAMKMQNELRAPQPGKVERIYASEGAGVETGVPLIRLA